jgi:predicted nuclease with TOPRIM domain
MNSDKTLNDQISEDENQQAVSATVQVDFLVKQMSADLDKLTEQIREQRRMVTDALKSDSRYQEISEKIKDLNKQRQSVQKELSANESVQKAREELQELNNQRKTIQSKLSDYLRQYVETFNSKTLEDLEGNLKEIITQYKLIKQRLSK